MAKLLKLRRGTTSQHSSFTGAEGELTVDTTKDTAVVHDGSTAGGRPLLREDLDNMPASGVSAGTYGSSSAIPALTVDAKGRVTGATTTAIDSTAITNGTSNVSVASNADITFTRSGTERFRVDSSGGRLLDGNKMQFGDANDLQIYHNGTNTYLDNNTGGIIIRNNVDADVGGDIYIQAKSGENSIACYDDSTVELYYDNSKKFETTNVGVAVTGNITLSGTVDGRDVAADGTKLDSIEASATADQSAAEILTAIKTVDGSGSGLDADLLDGQSSAYYRDASNLNAGTISASRLPTINSVPTGAIFLWSGAANSLPTGYVLCNGSNSTPNLQNRFVIGAGDSYAVDATGGATTVTLATANLPSHTHSTGNHTHSVGNHSHNVNNHTHSFGNHSHNVNNHTHSTPNHNHNMNSHTHSTNNTGGHTHNTTFYSFENNYPNQNGVPVRYSANHQAGNFATSSTGNHSHNTNSGTSNTNASGGGNTGNSAPSTSNTGGGTTGNTAPSTSNAGALTSGATSAGTTGGTGSGSAVNKLPPYYALCYIMKT
jgi:hypothetical protein